MKNATKKAAKKKAAPKKRSSRFERAATHKFC